MSLERTGMSLRFAWKQPRVRTLFFVALLIPLVVSGVFLWRVLPVVRGAQTMILHYTVYLGIDEVRHWTWVFFLPGLWFGITLPAAIIGLLSAQEDRLLSYSLLGFLLVWSAPWTVMLFYLALLNLR